MKWKIYVCILSSLFLVLTQAGAQTATDQPETASKGRPALLQGLSLGVDASTPIVKMLGGKVWGTEAVLRVSLRNKFFPVAELGYARYDATHDQTDIRYKTGAPYLRLGIDMNMLRDKTQSNRLLVGARLGYTTYKFDTQGPGVTDPLWGTSRPLDYQGLSSNRLWLEFVVGLEAEVLRGFHMGFNVRYKSKFKESVPAEATPYYIPGFGKGESSAFTLTYYLTFDLSKKIKVTTPKNSNQ